MTACAHAAGGARSAICLRSCRGSNPWTTASVLVLASRLPPRDGGDEVGNACPVSHSPWAGVIRATDGERAASGRAAAAVEKACNRLPWRYSD